MTRGYAPRVKRLLREPLLHFVAIGGLLFVLLRSPEAPAGPTPIVVSDSFVEGLAREEERRTGHAPRTDAERGNLVARHLRDEVLFREARRLGLDQGDPIVRRRLIQKMEFLLQSAADAEEPTDEELRAFLAERDFRRPERRAFEHVFFSRDRREDPVARARAALADAAATDGDPFVLGRRFGLRSETAVGGRLGAPFAEFVFATPADGEWHGPIESTYGAHLVRVLQIEEARDATLDEARPEVVAAWRDEARAESLERAVQELLSRYPVVRD